MILMTPGGQFARGGQALLEFVQFLAVRQMIVVQQMDHFFEGHLAGEFVNVVAAINQFAGLALDIAQAGAGGDDAFKAFGGRGGSRIGHVSVKLFNLKISQIP